MVTNAGMVTGRRPSLADWKQIGRYLGKADRTVQRWQSNFALPVRRTQGGALKAGVMAFRTEMDDWVRARRVGGKSHESERLGALQRRVEEMQSEILGLRRQIEAERAKKALDSSLHISLFVCNFAHRSRARHFISRRWLTTQTCYP